MPRTKRPFEIDLNLRLELTTGAFDEFIEKFKLSTEDQLVLLREYLLGGVLAAGVSLRQFLEETLGLEPESSANGDTPPWEEPKPSPAPPKPRAKKNGDGPLPNQQSLPFKDEKPKKGKKPQNLTGKRAGFRKGRKKLVGIVETDDGAFCDFVDENGVRYEHIERRLFTKLKDRSSEELVVDMHKDAPVVRLEIPAADVARYTKLLSKPNSVSKGASPGCMLKHWMVKHGGQQIRVEVVNGTPGKCGVYVDINAQRNGPLSSLTFTHEPVQTLVGRYKLEINRKPVVLEVVEV